MASARTPLFDQEAPNNPDLRGRACGTFVGLEQRHTWVDAQGVAHRIVEMDERYRQNVRAFLLRNAKRLEFDYSVGETFWIWDSPLAPSGDMAQLVVEEAQEQAWQDRWDNVVLWMLSTPLFRALGNEP